MLIDVRMLFVSRLLLLLVVVALASYHNREYGFQYNERPLLFRIYHIPKYQNQDVIYALVLVL